MIMLVKCGGMWKDSWEIGVKKQFEIWKPDQHDQQSTKQLTARKDTYLYCKFIDVCEGFIWRFLRPPLNRKNKYPQTWFMYLSN